MYIYKYIYKYEYIHIYIYIYIYIYGLEIFYQRSEVTFNLIYIVKYYPVQVWIYGYACLIKQLAYPVIRLICISIIT